MYFDLGVNMSLNVVDLFFEVHPKALTMQILCRIDY